MRLGMGLGMRLGMGLGVRLGVRVISNSRVFNCPDIPASLSPGHISILRRLFLVVLVDPVLKSGEIGVRSQMGSRNRRSQVGGRRVGTIRASGGGSDASV